MAKGSDSMGIDIPIRDQIIYAAVEAPGPGSNGPAVRRIIFFRLALRQPGINTGAGVRAIRIDIAAIKNGDRVTAPDNFFEGPVSGLSPARGVGGGIVAATGTRSAEPTGG